MTCHNCLLFCLPFKHCQAFWDACSIMPKCITYRNPVGASKRLSDGRGLPDFAPVK